MQNAFLLVQSAAVTQSSEAWFVLGHNSDIGTIFDMGFAAPNERQVAAPSCLDLLLVELH